MSAMLRTLHNSGLSQPLSHKSVYTMSIPFELTSFDLSSAYLIRGFPVQHDLPESPSFPSPVARLHPLRTLDGSCVR